MLLGISEVDQAAEKRRKVDGFVAALGVDDGTVASPIAGLFGVADDVSTQMTASPERQKLEIINALLKLCVAMSAKRPLLMILDDAHWIDPSTLEFVSRWIDALPGRRCLTLITARPEFVSPWKNLPHVTGLELNRLGKRETIALIEKIAGTSLPAPLLEQIVSRTDGVPLFIEELTKMIVEAGFLAEGVDFRGDLSLAIPDSLQDSLMARLDRLASVKEVAQVAAAIGRNFTLEVLARVQGRSDREVEDALSKLVDADLIVPMGGIVEKQSYRFRHALVQDAAYQSMLRSSRTAWHGRIASVLERDFPEEAEREPELLGHHFLLAGNHESAERYWLAAARMAIGRSANVEAIEHLNHALESLRRTPPSADRDRREMDLQIMIAVPLAFVNGYAHASVRTTYDRARDLCRQYGEMERLFKVVYGQFRSALLAGEYAVALKNVDHLGSLLSELNDPLLVAAIERSRGAVLTYLGRPEEAVQHLYKGAEAELTIDDRVRGLDFDVVDLKVALNGYLALSNWLRGRTSEAIEAIGNAVEHSRETDHPFSVSFALAFATWVYQFIGDEKAVQDYSARLIALSEENTFQFWMGWGRVMNGWARRAELGEKALTVIGQGLDEWRGTGSLLGLSYFLSLYASTAISLGRTDEAESLIAEAVAFEDDSGEAFWRPELIRLRAEAALAQSKYREGKEFLREAIACASKMGLHGPQIRAATALARLASDPDDQLEADAALGAALSKIAKDDPAAEEAMQVRQTLTVRRIG
jgi:tetratricopeptide (TPR) repeat protein